MEKQNKSSSKGNNAKPSAPHKSNGAEKKQASQKQTSNHSGSGKRKREQDGNEQGSNEVKKSSNASTNVDGASKQKPGKKPKVNEDAKPKEPKVESTKNTQKNEVGSLSVSSGFEWDDISFGGEGDSGKNKDKKGNHEVKKNKSAHKAYKKKEVADKEAELREKELASLEERQPQTANEFERLLLTSPNNSYLWMQYAAFHLSLSEFDKARKVIQRGLKRINLNEEDEKLNLWVAWLNLENSFGDKESLEHVFNEALAFMDHRKVFLKYVAILEKSEKYDEAEEIYKKMHKKFHGDFEVWKMNINFYVHQGRMDKFRALMPSAIQAVKKEFKIPMILKFAQVEYKEGIVERGRTIMDGVVNNYPKRTDVWSVYLDLELRNDDQDRIRNLFERITSLNLSSKKMMSFCQRWIIYEKEHGDEESIERVKEKAQQYIDSKAE